MWSNVDVQAKGKQKKSVSRVFFSRFHVSPLHIASFEASRINLCDFSHYSYTANMPYTLKVADYYIPRVYGSSAQLCNIFFVGPSSWSSRLDQIMIRSLPFTQVTTRLGLDNILRLVTTGTRIRYTYYNTT